MTMSIYGYTYMPTIDDSQINEKKITQQKDGNGNLYTSREETLDKNNNKIQDKFFNENGETTSNTICEYDENGNNTKVYDDLDGDNWADVIYEYEYYGNNSLKTELIDADADGNYDGYLDKVFHHEIEYSEEDLAQMKKEAEEKEKAKYESMNFFGKLFYNIGKGLSKLFFGE